MLRLFRGTAFVIVGLQRDSCVAGQIDGDHVDYRAITRTEPTGISISVCGLSLVKSLLRLAYEGVQGDGSHRFTVRVVTIISD